MLPILPLLFPVLWVLATACGEARVLAQMSKVSPSSLVGYSGDSGRNWLCQRSRAEVQPLLVLSMLEALGCFPGAQALSITE
jgi:hypothetical protein